MATNLSNLEIIKNIKKNVFDCIELTKRFLYTKNDNTKAYYSYEKRNLLELIEKLNSIDTPEKEYKFISPESEENNIPSINPDVLKEKLREKLRAIGDEDYKYQIGYEITISNDGEINFPDNIETPYILLSPDFVKNNSSLMTNINNIFYNKGKKGIILLDDDTAENFSNYENLKFIQKSGWGFSNNKIVFNKSIEYEIIDDHAAITRIKNFSGILNLETDSLSEYNGKLVTEIMSNALYDEDGENTNELTEIIIPARITKINKGAFKGASKLTSLTLPYVGETDFNEANNRDENYPFGFIFGEEQYEGASEISQYYRYFGYSSTTTKYYIPSSLKTVNICGGAGTAGPTIPYHVFYGCSNIESITLKNIKEINAGAFENSGVVNIEIPSNITEIEMETFKNCYKLKNITLPASITNIYINVFDNCKKVENVYYDGTLENWCNIEFSSYTSTPMYDGASASSEFSKRHFYLKNPVSEEYEELTDIVIPNTITKIKDISFYGFYYAESLEIPNTIIEIGEYAFSECFNNSNKNEIEITFPDSLRTIKEMAFYGCKKIKKIVIPSTVETIGNYVFIQGALDQLTISNTTTIGKNAFGSSVKEIYYNGTLENWCNNPSKIFAGSYSNYFYLKNPVSEEYEELREIEIPSTITEIKENTFFAFSRITKVTIPESITAIDNYAFFYCINLTNVYYLGSESEWNEITIGTNNTSLTDATIEFFKKLEYTLSNNGTYYILSGIGTCTDTNIIIPIEYNSKPIKEITDRAFYNCSNLESIEIPSSVTSIGLDAFSSCSSLTSIVIDDNNENYKSIDGNLYTKDGKTLIQYAIGKTATTFVVPSSVISIGEYAFSECSNLTSITIPSSVTSIGSYAFYECSSLANVYYLGSKSEWDQITIGTFNTNLTNATIEFAINFSYTLSNDETYYILSGIGNCKDTKIVIPEKYNDGEHEELPVKEISDSAFSGCSNLTSIEVPESIKKIGSAAFKGCSSLEKITLPFVGESAKTSSDTYQYPFGYIFGTSSYDGGVSTTQYYYGSSTSSIAHNTYYIPSSLKEVTITGENILRGAFYNCSNIEKITLPNNITSIGKFAFESCSSLASVTFGNNSQLTSIGESAFYNCSSLTDVYYDGALSDWCKITFSGYSSNPMYYAKHFYIKNSNSEYEELTEINIPSDITEIKASTFYGFNNVTKVIIPSSIESIGNRAFYNCHKLVEVYNLSTLNITAGSSDNGYVGYYATVIHTSLEEPQN